MAASEHLSGLQFRMHHHTIDDGNPNGHHMIEASTGNNRTLGVLTWSNGKIDNVSVKPKWERQGMATQMYQKALEITPRLRHSANRTDAGEGWAQKVGGIIPPRMQDEGRMNERH